MTTDVFEKFYLEHQDENGNLSPEHMAQMLSLTSEGDTGAQPESGEPEAAAKEPEAKPEPETPKAEEPAQPEPEPVVLAKDGVHTIPFEKLTEARAEAQKWAQVAKEKEAELEALKAQAQQPKPEPVATPEAKPEPSTEELFGDYSDGAIKKAVETLVERRVAAVAAEMRASLEQTLTPLQAQAQETAYTKHYTAIYGAHPDADAVVQSAEMKAFLDKQPSFVRDQYQAVLEKGAAAQVIELLDAFKKEVKAEPVTPTVKAEDVAAKAKETMAAAKPSKPVSLSDIPAGTAKPVDEAAAIREMSSTALVSKFSGQSPEKIMEMLGRLV